MRQACESPCPRRAFFIFYLPPKFHSKSEFLVFVTHTGCPAKRFKHLGFLGIKGTKGVVSI